MDASTEQAARAALLPRPPRDERTLARRAHDLRTWYRGLPGYTWWREVLIIAIGYGLYTLVRDGLPDVQGAAVARAFDVIRIELALHIFWELSFNHFVAHHVILAQVLDYYYATANFVVTIWVGAWVIARHRGHARGVRIAWYTTTLIGLVGFAFFPMAPPRLVPGMSFVDTVLVFHTWGSLGAKGFAASNQYAAMPSLHLAWALWCGVVIFKLARRRWVRAVGVAYPILTFVTIIGTGNHFMLDSAAGALTLALAFQIQRVITGASAFAPPGSESPLRERLGALARRRRPALAT